MKRFMLFVAVAVTVISISSACFCSPLSNPSQWLCKKQFFGVVQVLDGPRPCGLSNGVCHSVRILKHFKPWTMTIYCLSCRLTTIRTCHHSACCGKRYQVGKSYVVAGNPRHGVMDTSSC